MRIGERIQHFFASAATHVSALFSAVFGSYAAHKFGQAALAVLQTAAGQVATAAVEEVEARLSGYSGSDKRAAAFEIITAKLKVQGITAGAALIHMLIELAVQTLHDHSFTPAPSSASAPALQAPPAES